MPGLTTEGDDGLNMDELIGSVGEDLFPTSREGTEGEDAPASGAPELGKTADSQPEGQPGLTAAQIKALPKSWKRDMEPHWSKLPPEVHDYVYSREADIQRGLQEYATGHKQWQALLSPYQEILQQHPDVNPVELMQTLMNSHLSLARATPDERKTLAMQLLQSYGIQMDASEYAQTGDPALLNQIRTLESRLAQMESGLSAQAKAAEQQVFKEKLTEVERFSADPKNKYWDEVQNDIQRLLQTRAAGDLPTAYEMACWTNPAVRAKLLADQQGEKAAQSAAEAQGKTRFPNLNGNSDSSPRRQQKGSIDDTINSVVAKYTNLQ